MEKSAMKTNMMKGNRTGKSRLKIASPCRKFQQLEPLRHAAMV